MSTRLVHFVSGLLWSRPCCGMGELPNRCGSIQLIQPVVGIAGTHLLGGVVPSVCCGLGELMHLGELVSVARIGSGPPVGTPFWGLWRFCRLVAPAAHKTWQPVLDLKPFS